MDIINKKTPLQKALLYIFLIVFCLPFMMPFVYMVSTSLKGDDQIFDPAQAERGFRVSDLVPDPVVWDNYPQSMKSVPFLQYIKNTIVICFFCVIGAVLSSSMVAYGFARMKFAGRDALFYTMLATMALPGQVTMIPVFVIFKNLGWYDTFLPIIVPSFFGGAFFIFLLRQFFMTIPEELSEAARLDGASEWTIFSRVILPLAKPALATVALFQFIGSWNDFFGPLLYINNPMKYTIAYGLQQFMSSYGGRWAELMAASCVFTLPIIVIFFLAQKTFVQGIATTGGKS
ncbi:MAG: carbohydrate ABC transporter permease [Abditibacteriota bacterium]|nr:carbohydrate ABC transporter permease [Abditibacteriota bacterium]